MKSFSSLGAMALHLATLDAAVLVETHHAVDKVGKKIQKRAKAKLGKYQESDGVHDAWAELAESTKADRVSKGFTENDPGLRTGAMRSSIEQETHGLKTTIGSNDDHLVWFELGTNKQPPRSVLGAAAYELVGEIKKEFGEAVVTGIVGGRAASYKI